MSYTAHLFRFLFERPSRETFKTPAYVSLERLNSDAHVKDKMIDSSNDPGHSSSLPKMAPIQVIDAEIQLGISSFRQYLGILSKVSGDDSRVAIFQVQYRKRGQIGVVYCPFRIKLPRNITSDQREWLKLLLDHARFLVMVDNERLSTHYKIRPDDCFLFEDQTYSDKV